jgi:PIN domain nuclease of toxin-antitoxin system
MPQLKTLKEHRILVDTHVLLHALAGSSILTEEFHKVFEHARKTHGVLISAMSFWEVGMLVERKRIELDCDVGDWATQVLEKPGMQLSALTPRIAIQSSRLPGTVHGDPVDRMLIATAYEENAVLVTRDRKILEYGLENFISVFDPS